MRSKTRTTNLREKRRDTSAFTTCRTDFFGCSDVAGGNVNFERVRGRVEFGRWRRDYACFGVGDSGDGVGGDERNAEFYGDGEQ